MTRHYKIYLVAVFITFFVSCTTALGPTPTGAMASSNNQKSCSSTPTPKTTTTKGSSWFSGSYTSWFSTSSSSSSCLAEDTINNIRGGHVHEHKTLADVDASLMKASTDGKLVVIDFTATWCGPCKMIAPIFHDLSKEHTDVVFMKIDVDENSETAAKYQVSAMPTFLFIKQGNIVDRLMGANTQRLKELIEEHK